MTFRSNGAWMAWGKGRPSGILFPCIKKNTRKLGNEAPRATSIVHIRQFYIIFPNRQINWARNFRPKHKQIGVNTQVGTN